MKSSNVFHIAAFVALGAAACGGKLLVEGKPQSDGSASDVWTGNASTCPSDPPASLDPCDAAEGTVCAYRYADPATPGAEAYRECGCWLAQGGGSKWDCYHQTSGSPCPASRPEQGANCFGMRGQRCDYPVTTSCGCMDSSNPAYETWSCGSDLTATDPAPASLPAATPVSELDDAQRQAWCRWYLDTAIGVGRPDPIDQVDADGFATGPWCEVRTRPACNGIMPVIGTADCAANLALSSCRAPLDSLSDCVRTFATGGIPAPHGCAPYLDSPGCSGTIITSGAPLENASMVLSSNQSIPISSYPGDIPCGVTVR